MNLLMGPLAVVSVLNLLMEPLGPPAWTLAAVAVAPAWTLALVKPPVVVVSALTLAAWTLVAPLLLLSTAPGRFSLCLACSWCCSTATAALAGWGSPIPAEAPPGSAGAREEAAALTVLDGLAPADVKYVWMVIFWTPVVFCTQKMG